MVSASLNVHSLQFLFKRRVRCLSVMEQDLLDRDLEQEEVWEEEEEEEWEEEDLDRVDTVYALPAEQKSLILQELHVILSHVQNVGQGW